MTRRVELVSIYGRIWRTYRGWARSLILLAIVVFIPLGLIHSLTLNAEIGSLDLGAGLELLGLAAALLALGATGVIGEVFYTGAVAISLTHPHGGRPPSLREIAGTIRYGRLIVVDLFYGILVALGFAAFFVPGVLVYIWLGLAAPVVEIERRGIRAAFARSAQLVRGRFWLVACVLVPLEVAGDAAIDIAAHFSHELLGASLFSEWLADVLANVAFTPFYAVAAVLLTVDLIREKGGGSELHSKPPP